MSVDVCKFSSGQRGPIAAAYGVVEGSAHERIEARRFDTVGRQPVVEALQLLVADVGGAGEQPHRERLRRAGKGVNASGAVRGYGRECVANDCVGTEI